MAIGKNGRQTSLTLLGSEVKIQGQDTQRVFFDRAIQV